MSDVSDRFNELLNEVPDLVEHPEIAAPLALGGAAPEVAKGVTGILRGEALVRDLTALPATQEIEAWSRLSKADQNFARAAGYTDQIVRDDQEKKRAWYDIRALPGRVADYLDFATGDISGAVSGVGDFVGGAADVTGAWFSELAIDDALDQITPDVVTDNAGEGLAWAYDKTIGNFVDQTVSAGKGFLDIYGDVTGSIDQAYRATEIGQTDEVGDGSWIQENIPSIPFISTLPSTISGVVDTAKAALPGGRSIKDSDLVRWWNEADRSKAPVDASEEKAAEEKYGEIARLARAAQKDKDYLANRRAELIEAGNQEEISAFETIIKSEEFGEAYDMLNRALLSPGRQLARDLHVDDNEDIQKWVSGTGDAVYRVLTDPILVGGKVVQAGRTAKYGLGTDNTVRLDRLDKLFSGGDTASANVRRFWDNAGEHIGRYADPQDFGDMARAREALKRDYSEIDANLLEQMSKFRPSSGNVGVRNADDAHEFFAGKEQWLALIQGQSAVRRPLMPYRTVMGEKALKGRGKVIDFTKARLVRSDLVDDLVVGAHNLGDSTVKQWDTAGGADVMAGRANAIGDIVPVGPSVETTQKLRQTSKGRGKWAVAYRRMTTKLPTFNENNVIDVMAPNAIDDVERLASMVAPKYWAREVAGIFSKMDEAGRKNVIKGIYATMFESAGVTKTAAGQEWAKGFFKAMDDIATGTYSVTAAGKTLTGDEAAIFLADASSKMPLLNFAEFVAQSQKIGYTSSLHHAANKPIFDWYMQKVWRPSVLLRPALAFRNSIEETLNQYVRQGLGTTVKGQAMLRTANRRQAQAQARFREDALIARQTSDEMNAALIGQFPKAQSLDDVEGSIDLLRARAAELRGGPFPQRAGVASGEKEWMRAESKANMNSMRRQADKLDAKANRLQQELNKARSYEYAASRKAMKADNNPSAFDTEMGRMFRAVTAMPRALGRRLAPIAESSSNDSLRAVSDILSNPERGVYQFYKAHVYGKFAETYLKTVDPDALRFVDELVDNAYARDLFMKEIMETASLSARNQIDNVAGRGRPGILQGTTVERSTGKRHELVDVAGERGAKVWSMRLEKILEDDATRWIFLHLDDPYVAARGAERVYRRKEYQRLRNVQQKGPAKFSGQMYNEVKAHVSDANGNVNWDLWRKIVYKDADGPAVNMAAISPARLNQVANDLRPAHVIGSDVSYIELMEGPMATLVSRGFTAIGDMTAYMSRQRQFFTNYMEARRVLMPLESEYATAMGGTISAQAAAKQAMVREALDIATVKSVGYVDNPRVRSQAAVLMRNFAPFYRAQEEFFVRWARTMKYNPESYGRAFLTLHAASSSSYVEKDENGDWYFVYPGSDYLHRFLAETSQVLGIELTRLPVVTPMTGKVQMLTAGFNPDQSINPFSGPVLTTPLRTLAAINKNPTLQQWEQRLLGPGADRSLLESNIPAILRPAYESGFLTGKPDEDDRTELSVMAALFANGNGLPKDATAKQKQEFLDAVRRHSNGLRAVRSILGPSLPAYPRLTPDSPASIAGRAAGFKTIKQEFFDLVDRLEGDYEAAYAHWMKERPLEVPFLETQYDSNTMARFDGSKQAGQFLAENVDLIKNYPLAGSFFIPMGGESDLNTFKLAMDLGIKEVRDKREFLDDLIMADGLGHYFDQRKLYEDEMKSIKEAGGDRSELEERWRTFKSEFYAVNPLVADYLADGGRRARDRDKAVEEMDRLLNNGDAPEGETADKFRAVIESFKILQVDLESVEGEDEFARQEKQSMRDRFDEYMQQMAADDPQVEQLYRRLFKAM